MTSEAMFKEKRVYPRFAVEFPVKYRLVDGIQAVDNVTELRKREVNSQTMDLSLGGMFIASPQRLDVGSILTFQCVLPKNLGSFSAFGEVVWANGTGGGVHFLAIREDSQKLLATVLEKASHRS